MSSGEPTSVPPLPRDPAAFEPPLHEPSGDGGRPAATRPMLDPAPIRRANQVDPPPDGGADWPAQAADTIVDVVDRVRNATTGPALTVMRGVVYGVAIAIVGIAAVVLLVVAAVRFVDVYLPGGVWSAHLLIGALSTVGGLVLWSKRRPEGSSAA
ncbi:MAG: hypothetical protein JJE52_00705 [Acidimicrobiia bacterium]|nr:hypothetical protein [Acidimicrobiia bacterium]